MGCRDARYFFLVFFSFLRKDTFGKSREIKDLPPCCSLLDWPEEKEVPVMYGSCSFWFQSRAITAGLACGTLVNLLQVVSHRTIDMRRSRWRTVAGSVIARLLISKSSRPSERFVSASLDL